jgi:MFS family permease
VFVLMLGRFFQAIADNAMWIASLAIISDTIPSQHTGKVMGFVNVAASIGTSGGPMVAGVFFEKLGYWPAWSAAFTILVFDIILRLLMLDKQKIDTKNTGELYAVGFAITTPSASVLSSLPLPQLFLI